MDHYRDLGRHDSDILNIKDDIHEIKASLEELKDHMISQKAQALQSKDSLATKYAIVVIISSLVSIVSNFFAHIFTAKGIQ